MWTVVCVWDVICCVVGDMCVWCDILCGRLCIVWAVICFGYGDIFFGQLYFVWAVICFVGGDIFCGR